MQFSTIILSVVALFGSTTLLLLPITSWHAPPARLVTSGVLVMLLAAHLYVFL
jgi:hypothetical protein